MRALALAAVLAAVAAAPAPAAELMVVGRSGTLLEPRVASEKGAAVRVSGRRCRLAPRTPLAALARTRLTLSLRDYGRCGRPAEASGLYVRSVSGQAERGRAGWVYKVDDRVLPVGAGDPASRFGRRARVLWFWCRDASGCQRTLSVHPERRTAAPGSPLRVRVRAHDDLGEAVPAAQATVTMGSARATTGPDGTAVLTVPQRTGRLPVVAAKRGLVRSFAERVEVR
jgi:hypothetical protein